MPESVTLEEMEQEQAKLDEAAKQPAPTDLGAVKFEGDDVPEIVRGKSAAEVAKLVDTMSQSLRLSEVERQALAARVQQQGPAAVVEEQIPEWDREKFKTMYEEDPIAAIEAMGNHLAANLHRSFETRIQPLAQGTVRAAEEAARQKYATEFELFGDQIEQFARSVPDKSVLSNSKGWDDLISYVRGQPQNFDLLLERRAAPAKTTARETQRQSTGFTAAPAASGIAPGGDVQLDDTGRRIMQTFIDNGTFKDEAEYKRWMTAGGQ